MPVCVQGVDNLDEEEEQAALLGGRRTMGLASGGPSGAQQQPWLNKGPALRYLQGKAREYGVRQLSPNLVRPTLIP